MHPSSDLKERDFHDRWADGTLLSEINVFEAFECITAQENRFILQLMGNLKDARLLDIGAGLGESSVYFALKGARVTANDISPRMLDCCVALGRKHGVQISTLLGAAENFNFGDSQFDIDSRRAPDLQTDVIYLSFSKPTTLDANLVIARRHVYECVKALRVGVPLAHHACGLVGNAYFCLGYGRALRIENGAVEC